jgi:lysozyme
VTPETRDQLVADLARDEGEVLHAYQDSLGYWTIGIGVLIDKAAGGGITKEESRYLFNNRLARTVAEVRLALPWVDSLSENRQRVVFNMAYNLGITKLRGFKNTLTAMSVGRYQKAADGMRASRWYRQVGKRAERLAALMEQG